MKKTWPFTFNLLIFSAFAFCVPFLVLYYQRMGFTGAQIGLMTGITPLITLLSTPLWTTFADATRRHRLCMRLTLLLGAISVSIFPFLNAFLPILVLAILFSAVMSPITSFADSAAMFMLADQKEKYGRIRLGGTIGFGLAAAVAGIVVQQYSLNLAFWGCAVLLLLALLVSQNLAYNPQPISGSTRQSVRALLTDRRWLLFLTMGFAGGFALAGTNTYFFPYLRELGANESTMGFALTLGTVSEIPVLFFGNRLLRRFKPQGLLRLAMVFTGLRALAFAAASTPQLALLIQLLNGLTFPAMWVAGVAYADEHAPIGLNASAQGMFSAMVMGFGAAVGGFVGGPLLESHGGRGLYLVFGTVVLVTVALVIFVQSRLPVEPTTAPTTAAN